MTYNAQEATRTAGQNMDKLLPTPVKNDSSQNRTVGIIQSLPSYRHIEVRQLDGLFQTCSFQMVY